MESELLPSGGSCCSSRFAMSQGIVVILTRRATSAGICNSPKECEPWQQMQFLTDEKHKKPHPSPISTFCGLPRDSGVTVIPSPSRQPCNQVSRTSYWVQSPVCRGCISTTQCLPMKTEM